MYHISAHPFSILVTQTMSPFCSFPFISECLLGFCLTLSVSAVTWYCSSVVCCSSAIMDMPASSNSIILSIFFMIVLFVFF